MILSPSTPCLTKISPIPSSPNSCLRVSTVPTICVPRTFNLSVLTFLTSPRTCHIHFAIHIDLSPGMQSVRHPPTDVFSSSFPSACPRDEFNRFRSNPHPPPTYVSISDYIHSPKEVPSAKWRSVNMMINLVQGTQRHPPSPSTFSINPSTTCSLCTTQPRVLILLLIPRSCSPTQSGSHR